MDLEFEVTSQYLKRTDTNTVYNKDYDNYTCVFDFGEDNDLITGDNYVIFKDAWNNKITIHLEKNMNVVSCPLPNKMLRGSLFKVYVLGEEWKTNIISIEVEYSSFPKTHTIIEENSNGESEYDYEYDNHIPILVDGCNRPHHECSDTVECNKNEVDVFTEIFSKLDTFIDRIIYTDKQLLLYNKDTLIKTINLPFLTDEDVQELNFIDNLSSVAISGDYNDLNNIPVEFNPSHHNHLINDVSDYEDNFNYDLNLILDLLSDEISKN